MNRGNSNDQQRHWFRVTRNAADSIDIDIYGDIGERTDWWTGEKEGIGAKAFLDELRAASGKAVNLHINSGGGSVVDAYAMMTAISNHDGKVTAYIDGLAASAASFLVAAADEVVMSSVAWMMIHKASIIAWGNADDLRSEVEYLEKIDAQIAGIYAKRSGVKSEEEFAEAMAATTWYTADDALEWGLIDDIEEAVAAAACFTEDKTTWNTAPDAARHVLTAGLMHAVAAEPIPGDTSGNITGDGDEPAEQEPVAAQARVVPINGRLFKVEPRDHR